VSAKNAAFSSKSHQMRRQVKGPEFQTKKSQEGGAARGREKKKGGPCAPNLCQLKAQGKMLKASSSNEKENEKSRNIKPV